MTSKTPAPLTEAEFNEGAVEVDGVYLHDDEDGYWIFSYGHVKRSRFVEAVNKWLVELGAAQQDLSYTERQVEHRWARTVTPAPEWRINWSRDHTSETPGTFPVTVLYV